MCSLIGYLTGKGSAKKLSKKELDNKDRRGEDESREDRKSLRWTSLGIEFVGVMGIFAYLGYLADERFRTGPWLMFIGFVTAFVGMTYLLFKETKKWRG